MEKLSEKLNFSERSGPERSIKIDPRRDVNYYETLCLYCAENDINLNNLEQEEIDAAVNIIENYGSAELKREPFYFWID